MKRNVFSLAMLLCGCLAIFAQQMPQLTPLPLKPEVKSGKLPNGLSYYLLHNEEPKERANFYIAQKVGSTLETPDQLGLAHFLEHMAFNGTKNYPGKNMLNYLQSKGIRFGFDINAYTSFDETVYNINNIPTTDKALMDSVLLVLSDWSGSILLEEAEIEAERGVIQEEWRQRNDANTRMFTAVLPQLYQEYQYQQMPIGKMEIVMNFKPQVLRDYYHKWYRPDQQGIIIVGDFDVNEMEKKVVDLFSKIPMPENAAERTYPHVSDNEKPIYVSYRDAEMPYYRATVSFKYEKTPAEYRNTQEVFISESLVQGMLSRLINNRLSEYAQKAECPYAQAGCYFGDYYIAKTKGAFNISVVAKDDLQKAFASALSIVARACKTGFTDSEVARVRDEIMSSYENYYNERNKIKSESLAKELIKYFIDNDPMPGVEKEYELASQVLPMISAPMINQVCAQILTSNNQVILVSQPDGDNIKVYGEELMTTTLNDALNAEYEAYVDEVITDPLIAKLPKPGSIKKTAANAEFGATEFTLSNGVRVIVKPTDFSNDEILMTAVRKGGKQIYAQSLAPDVLLIDGVFDMTQWGPFSPDKLQKYLSGKRVGLVYSVGNYTNTLEGSSTVKDLPTLMELLYTAFTGLSADQNTYDAQMSKIRSFLALKANDPQNIFGRHLSQTRFGGNALAMPLNVETLDKNNYAETLKLLKQTLSNAADYTFVFSGNIDIEKLKTLLCQYVATLPAGKPSVPKTVTSMDQVKGQVSDIFTQPMQTPSTNVVNIYSGNIDYSVRNSYMVQLTGDILEMIYTETLREEEGGTYGANVGAGCNPVNNEWTLLYQFMTNKDQQDQLMKRAHAELLELLEKGTNQDRFSKVKEAAIKQLEIQERTNSYWQSAMAMYARGYNTIKDERAVLESITLQDLNNFMKNLYDGKNRIQVVMEGVETK